MILVFCCAKKIPQKTSLSIYIFKYFIEKEKLKMCTLVA